MHHITNAACITCTHISIRAIFETAVPDANGQIHLLANFIGLNGRRQSADLECRKGISFPM